MGVLLDQAALPASLTEAWEEVLANDAADDMLSSGVQRFAERAGEIIAELSELLATAGYMPQALTEVVIAKDDGGERILRIPAVRDRVVERSLLSVLVPRIDPWLGPASFAFRPGLGVADAVRELASRRDEGYRWVLRTDIDDCFPSIDTQRARRSLAALVDDDELLAVVDLLLERTAQRPRSGRVAPVRGLAQGSPLSPLLANLVLEHVDQRLWAAGFPVIRFADDIAVPVVSKDEGWEAARVATNAVEEMGMTLGAEDTDVMSFDEGFVFLGEAFGPRYPPTMDNPMDVPDHRTLFVGRPGTRVRMDEGRILVEHQDAELLSAPAGLVARIVCFGPVGVSSGLRNWALANGVDLAFCSQRGRYLGSAVSGHVARAGRLRRQVEWSADESRFLPFGRAIIEAKIRKQIVLLRRMARRDKARELSEAVAQAQGYLAMLPEAQTREEIMGLEGAVARTYFQAWQQLLPAELGFGGRNRRPPQDVVNSALSYGYAVLVAEGVSALVAAGLEPVIGFLHRDDDDRPSLALDLIEEFRPLVVDQVVMEAVGHHRLGPEHGRRDEQRGGVLLTSAGREALLDGYERRMLRMTRGACPVSLAVSVDICIVRRRLSPPG